MATLFGKRVQLAFWVMLFSFNLYMGSLALVWPEALARSAMNLACHLLNFYVFYSVLVPRYFEEKKYVHTFLGSIALLIAITPARLAVEDNFDIAGNFANRFGYTGRVGFVLFTEVTIGGFASLLRLANDNELT